MTMLKTLPQCVAVFGLGQFGFAIAKLLSDNHPQIPVIAYDTAYEFVDKIMNTRMHPIFHKGSVLGPSVKLTKNIQEAIIEAKVVVLAVPGQYIRGLIKNLAPLIRQDTIFLNLAKTMEDGTNKYMSTVVEEELANIPYYTHFTTLSGGMIAEEVTKCWPIAADVACKDLQVAKYVAALFETPFFKLNVTSDVRGVELAGALKNVVAIGAGFYDGLQYETSSKAAFISEASREICGLALALGARKETFDLGGHAWLGDLLTTCFGKSRNRYFGELLGKGFSVSGALQNLEKERKRSEGYLATRSFHSMAKQYRVPTPILDTIYSVLFEEKPVSLAVAELWKITTPPKF